MIFQNWLVQPEVSNQTTKSCEEIVNDFTGVPTFNIVEKHDNMLVLCMQRSFHCKVSCLAPILESLAVHQWLEVCGQCRFILFAIKMKKCCCQIFSHTGPNIEAIAFVKGCVGMQDSTQHKSLGYGPTSLAAMRTTANNHETHRMPLACSSLSQLLT